MILTNKYNNKKISLDIGHEIETQYFTDICKHRRVFFKTENVNIATKSPLCPGVGSAEAW